MVKKELSETEIAESIPDLWQPLTQEQREFLAQNFTIQKYKKNETIYCEGETPMHLMCLLSGKVKIYKEGVGGRSQIIRVLPRLFCRGQFCYGSICVRTVYYLPNPHAGHYEISESKC